MPWHLGIVIAHASTTGTCISETALDLCSKSPLNSEIGTTFGWFSKNGATQYSSIQLEESQPTSYYD